MSASRCIVHIKPKPRKKKILTEKDFSSRYQYEFYLEELKYKKMKAIMTENRIEYMRKYFSKTNERNEKERITIHKIANSLIKYHTVSVTCHESCQIGKYAFENGKKYLILAVDFRSDDNYVIMTEMNDKEPLFDGKLSNIFDICVKSQNKFEFIRRGYFYTSEEIPELEDLRQSIRDLILSKEY